MDQKSKILSAIIALAVLASVGTAFYKTIIKKDFQIIESESEEATDVEDTVVLEEATGLPGEEEQEASE